MKGWRRGKLKTLFLNLDCPKPNPVFRKKIIRKTIEMLKIILATLLIVAICIALLCVKILFKKNGRFPNTHVSGSKAMRERGIGCVQSQDREQRKINPNAISERSKE